eukprot:474817-Amphidinium_carterae.1
MISRLRQAAAPACQSLESVIEWAWEYVNHLENAWPELWSTLRSNMIGPKTLEVSSDFSGFGMPELAMQVIGDAVFHKTGSRPKVVLYRACDLAGQARKALLSLHSTAHVFGDVRNGVPDNVARKLARLSHSSRMMRTQHESRERSREDRREFVTRLGTALVHRCDQEMRNVQFDGNRTAFCYRHNQHCPVRSNDDAYPHGVIRLLIAGVPCTDHSVMGSRKAASGDTAVTLSSWAADIKSSPHYDLLLLECTPLFPERLQLSVFEEMYSLESFCYSPTDLSIPANRRRKYMLLRLRSRVVALSGYVFGEKVFGIDAETEVGETGARTFAEVFFRTLEASGDLFFKASADERREMVLSMARARHLLEVERLRSEHSRIPLSLALAPCQARAWKAYKQRVSERRAHAIVNVCQSASFATTHKMVVPTLLTKTSCLVSTKDGGKVSLWVAHVSDVTNGFGKIWHLSHVPRQMLMPEEYALVMGVPVESLLKDVHLRATQLIDISPLSPSEIRQLMGNSMHMSAVGTALVYALATSKF